MATSKHTGDASLKITDYINDLPDWSRAICERLRSLVLKSDPAMIEDWKWGPNYYLDGMVCGFAGFQKHVNFVFFQGSLLKDKKKILIASPTTLNNRHVKITDIKQIDENVLLAYIAEAIINNKKGKKRMPVKDKTVSIAPDITAAFKAAGLLKQFELLAWSHKKEYLQWIEDAKKEETRHNRIAKATEMLMAKETMHQKYKK